MRLDDLRADRDALRHRWRSLSLHTSQTIPDMIRISAISQPKGRTFFHSAERPTRSLTCYEAYVMAMRLACALQARGVGPGDVVAIQMPIWWECTVTAQAVYLCGATVLPIVTIYGPRELGFILEQTKAKIFVTADRFYTTDFLVRLPQLPPLPHLQDIVVVGDNVPSGCVAWRELFEGDEWNWTEPKIDADDVCTIFYTSGTTSVAKGVRHTHNTLLAEVRSWPIFRATAIDNPVSFAAGRWGHVGCIFDLLAPIFFGVEMVLLDKWEASMCLKLIQAHKPSFASGVPFQMLALTDRADAGVGSIASLRYFAMGSTSISPSHIRRMRELGVEAFRIYGCTEHPTISSGRPGDPEEKRASTDGRPLPAVEIKLVDDQGETVAPGEAGEIATRGPELFVGYVDETLDEAAFLPGGWYLTGDIGRVDQDGFLSVIDRKKDLIIRAGENISSKEVEDILMGHPAVREAAVVAMHDERYGERICAFVIPRDQEPLTLADVSAHFVTQGVAKQKIPERLELVNEFPRTQAGKIRKADLRASLQSVASE